MGNPGLRFVERLAWIVGIAALGSWLALRADAQLAARQHVDRIARARAGATPPASPDFSLWSSRAIAAWKAGAEHDLQPLAVFRIARLGLEAPVLEGTSNRALDQGLGHVEDTPAPGASGNTGIAGHRDSFFRVLKDVAVGDTVTLELPDRTDTYEVTRTWIVAPEDVWVLDPTREASVTLVTCYPFYYVGSAPQRFIVRAVRTGTVALSNAPGTPGHRSAAR